jgi:hypothetical protein
MMKRKLLLALLIGILVSLAVPAVWKTGAVSGKVVDPSGDPIEGALVRVKAANSRTFTDSRGNFSLTGFEPRFGVHITAWADGHYIGGVKVFPWSARVEIQLASYTREDNGAYHWIPPEIGGRSDGIEWFIRTGLFLAGKVSFDRLFLPLADNLALGCKDCHPDIVAEWRSSSHALGKDNPIFLTMYNGTDVNGRQSPEAALRENPFYYGRLTPAKPDPDLPYFGPGFKLDFPDINGNCAACHLPGASLDDPYGTDPNSIDGTNAKGSHCDFCHKIAGVALDNRTGVPPVNLPGVLALEFARPEGEHQIFFGPLDDVDVGPDTYLPLMKESAICAPCHNASFWNVPIYQSFNEWLQSPYSADGVTCQKCHMAPTGSFSNFAPDRGGVDRDPEMLASHGFPGASDTVLLQESVKLESSYVVSGNLLKVAVDITNEKAGHHIPTDSPLRHLILVVVAKDEHGDALPLRDGSLLPTWTGIGDPAEGFYSGLPGEVYAKVLEELWTGISPSGAYWTPTRILSDNRIPAMETARSSYTFLMPENGQVQVQVRLIFRRAFIELMNLKGWQAPDILLARQIEIVN